jgi:hypothetical protein
MSGKKFDPYDRKDFEDEYDFPMKSIKLYSAITIIKYPYEIKLKTFRDYKDAQEYINKEKYDHNISHYIYSWNIKQLVDDIELDFCNIHKKCSDSPCGNIRFMYLGDEDC